MSSDDSPPVLDAAAQRALADTARVDREYRERIAADRASGEAFGRLIDRGEAAALTTEEIGPEIK